MCWGKKHASKGSCGVRWQRRRPQGPACRLWNISALWFLAVPGFIDFKLNGWCRCRAQTTALLCRSNILPSNKHQPGCQHEQLLLFKAVSFKGDELEWLGWCNQVGGLDVVCVIYENWGVDRLNSFVLFASYESRLAIELTTNTFCCIAASMMRSATLRLCKADKKSVKTRLISAGFCLSCLCLCLLIPVIVGWGTGTCPLLACWWLKALRALLLPDRWGLFEGIDESSSSVVTRPLLIWETHS